MSGWLLAVREVYQAGGAVPAGKLTCALHDINDARRWGALEKPGRRGRHRNLPVTITPLGVALCEGRVQKVDARLGRRWQATWLAALPRANEVRLTPPVQRAQNDGTCYW
jgi:hypothetical protein